MRFSASLKPAIMKRLRERQGLIIDLRALFGDIDIYCYLGSSNAWDFAPASVSDSRLDDHILSRCVSLDVFWICAMKFDHDISLWRPTC